MNILRVVAIGLFAFAFAQAIVICLTVRKLRTAVIPPPRLLAWHVYAITVYALGFHALTMVERFDLLDDNPQVFGLVATVVLGVVGNIALGLIGQVVRVRRAISEQTDEAMEHPP